MPTILIADDDRLIRQLLENCLRNAGHAVLVAQNGHDAFNLACKHSVGVVILDMNMPEIDGWTAARMMKDQIDPRMQIIAISAYGLPGDIARAKAAGCERFLTKPIEISVLMQTVDEAFNCISADSRLELR